MEFSKNYEYNGNQFTIPKNGKYLDSIWLNFEIDKLPQNYAWDEYFIFKYLRSITIKMDDLIFYKTNGLILKTHIDMSTRHPRNTLFKYSNTCDKNTLKYIVCQNMQLYVPIELPIRLPIQNITSDIKLHIEFNEHITIPMMSNLPIRVNVIFKYCDENDKMIKLSYPKNDPNLCYLPQPYCEKIIINEEFGNIHKHKFICNSYIKHLIIYIDGDIEIDSVKITLNHSMEKTYAYMQMNTIFPYLNDVNTTDKILFIPFKNNDHFDGINLNRVDSTEIEFRFSKNNGGNMYILSEITNIIKNINTQPSLLFTTNIKMDDWSRLDNIMYQYDGNFIDIADEDIKIEICI